MSVSLVAQAPAKILLFGEWAVLEGAPAILQSLSVFFKTSLKKTDSNSLILKHQNEEFHFSNENQKIPEFWSLTLKILKSFNKNFYNDHYKGYTLETQSDWKISEGLGSSSALFLTLFLIDQKLSQNKTYSNSNELWEKIWPAYQKVFQGSGADLAAQVFGGSIVYRKGQADKISLSKPEDLIILHSGKKLNTQNALKKQYIQAQWSNKIEKSVLDFLVHRDWEKTIEEHRRLLCEKNIMRDEFQNILLETQKSNLIKTMKSTGAGGGDAFLALLQKNSETKLHEYLISKSWWSSNYAWSSEVEWSLQ
jgi:mevalonate kinase